MEREDDVYGVVVDVMIYEKSHVNHDNDFQEDFDRERVHFPLDLDE